MSEYEEEAVEEEAPEAEPQPQGFEDLPKATQAEIKKLRKEHESLRRSNRELQDAVLTAKYGEAVLEYIPEEVTDATRRAELAEKYKGLLGTTAGEENPSESAAEAEPVEAPSEAEERMSAFVGSPKTGTSSPASDMSARDLLELGKSNPAEADRLIRLKYRTP